MNMTNPSKLLTILPRGLALSRTLLLICLLGLFAACASNDEPYDEVQNLTDAYEKARESIARGNFRRGIQIFEAMQARYPFSDLSRQVQLELMYAYYKSGQPERAIDAADTFIRENPINPRVDYALYIKALAFFEGDPGFLERWFRRNMDKRPPEGVDQSYLRRGAYVAAINRAKAALEQYNGAKGNAQSLQILAKAYDKLGMSDLANDARRVLAANFPGES